MIRDAEHAPYVARPSHAITGQWVVMGTLSARYLVLAFMGTENEARAVAGALNDLAERQAAGREMYAGMLNIFPRFPTKPIPPLPSIDG